MQIDPVGGPPRRSADKTPAPSPVVRKKKLQVATSSSTGAANARNKPVVQVLVAVKRLRNTRLYIWDLQMSSKIATRRAE